GFEVELAIDGATAIGRLARGPVPDILVTDLRMPYADGCAVAEYGRARRPGLPIFIVTGYPEQMTELERSMKPPPTVLPKPVGYRELVRGLREATGQAT